MVCRVVAKYISSRIEKPEARAKHIAQTECAFLDNEIGKSLSELDKLLAVFIISRYKKKISIH